MTRRAGLMTDLDHVLARVALERRSHALGMVHRERHGLLLIHVLAGVERSAEMLGVQVLRRGDDHGVDGFVVEQASMVEIRRSRGDQALRALKLLGVDVAERDDFRAGAHRAVMESLGAAIAKANEADTDAIVRAPHLRRSSREGAGESGDFAEKLAPGVHKESLAMCCGAGWQPAADC